MRRLQPGEESDEDDEDYLEEGEGTAWGTGSLKAVQLTTFTTCRELPKPHDSRFSRPCDATGTTDDRAACSLVYTLIAPCWDRVTVTRAPRLCD